MRFPVNVKSALHTAGITGGSAGSPNPVGELSVLRKWTSISGGACVKRVRERVGFLPVISGYVFVGILGRRIRPRVLFRVKSVALLTTISVPVTIAYDLWNRDVLYR